MNESEIELLKRFNAKANEIFDSGFLSELKEKKLGVDIKFSFNEKGIGEIKTNSRLHDKNILDSVLLKLRFFVQDGDGMSIREMRSLYKKLKIEQSYKNEFNRIDEAFQKFKTQKAFTFLRESPTKWDLFYAKFYGEKVHEAQKETLKKFKIDDVNSNLVDTEFERIVEIIIYVVATIRNLNNKVLKKAS